MAEISIIMPVYNVEKYLTECLDSLLAQTFSDFEVIPVDDSSTDDSFAILQQYAQKDNRIKPLQQPNSGAGAARNTGIGKAQGKYMMFLDSDDWFDPTMLADMFAVAEKNNAEITVCRHRRIRDKDRACVSEHQFSHALRSLAQPFSLKEHPRFWGTPGLPFAPWCYLYRSDFIREHDHRFQLIPRANDLYFTQTALVMADKIALCDSCVVNYRVGISTNLQSGNAKTPLTFLDALCAVMNKLKSEGLYARFEQRFADLAARLCLTNLEAIYKLDSCRILFDHLQERGLKELGIMDRPADYFEDPDTAKRIALIRDLSFDEYILFLIGETKRLRAENSLLADQLQQTETLYRNAINSASFRVGKILTAPLRWLKGLFKHG